MLFPILLFPQFSECAYIVSIVENSYDNIFLRQCLIIDREFYQVLQLTKAKDDKTVIQFHIYKSENSTIYKKR